MSSPLPAHYLPLHFNTNQAPDLLYCLQFPTQNLLHGPDDKFNFHIHEPNWMKFLSHFLSLAVAEASFAKPLSTLSSTHEHVHTHWGSNSPTSPWEGPGTLPALHSLDQTLPSVSSTEYDQRFLTSRLEAIRLPNWTLSWNILLCATR